MSRKCEFEECPLFSGCWREKPLLCKTCVKSGWCVKYPYKTTSCSERCTWNDYHRKRKIQFTEGQEVLMKSVFERMINVPNI